VMLLSIDLFRYGMDIYERRLEGSLTSWQMRKIEERLNEVAAPPSLVMLAELCRLSVRQLTRKFRASCGCSVGDYVSKRQIEHAKRLLSEDESVALIAQKLGFSSTSNFCYAFKRETGLSPGNFRQKLLGE